MKIKNGSVNVLMMGRVLMMLVFVWCASVYWVEHPAVARDLEAAGKMFADRLQTLGIVVAPAGLTIGALLLIFGMKMLGTGIILSGIAGSAVILLARSIIDWFHGTLG